MTTTYLTAPLYRWKLVRIMRVRWRLFLAALVALLVFPLLPSDWRLINRVLVGWDVGVVVYLILAIELAMTTDTNHIRGRCVLYDEGRMAIPVLTVTAALASIGAIFVQLTTAPAGHHFLNLVFAAVTILLSWSFIQSSSPFVTRTSSTRNIGGKQEGSAFQMTTPPIIGTSSTLPL